MARRAPPHTRSELLRAAEACFAEHGLESTKVEDITTRAGIAKGAFYSYFEGKEDCWREIVDAFLARLGDACSVSGAVAQVEAGRTVEETFAGLLAHDVEIIEFCWENRALLRMLLSGAGAASYAYLIDEFATRAAENVEAVLRALIEAGAYRDDVDTRVVALLVGGAYDRLVRDLIRREERPDIEALCAQTHRLFMCGLLTDAARAAMGQGAPEPVARRASGAASVRRASCGGRRRS